MNTEKRIAVACFLGASIGALLAIQFGHYFRVLGVILGGFVGYLSYEFKKVLEALKTARKRTWEEMTKEYHLPTICWADLKKEWKDRWEEAKKVLGLFALFLAVGIVGTSWLLLLNPFLSLKDGPLLVVYYLIPTVALAVKVMINLDRIDHDNPNYVFQVCTHFLLLGNSVVCICWLLPRSLIWIIKKIPLAISFILRVAKTTFILVHSEIRLLCMTDAVIGALIGYFCGNALIGGITGAICGVLNYRLVSIKWLKLVPQ